VSAKRFDLLPDRKWNAMAEFTTLQEMVLIAHAKMEPAAWDFVNGGTESEVTLRRNRHGLDRLAFRSRVLNDVARIDTSTTFLGYKLALPVMMAPVGSLALIDPAAAVSVAGACKTCGSLLIYSTFADPPLENVRSKVDHPLILGLYVRGDQAWLDEAVDAAVAAGCLAIAVVTEAPYYSRRERDLINRFRSRGSKSTTYAATQKVLREGSSVEAVAAAEARMVTARLTWKTIERIRRRSSLPIILKGISTAEDARLAVEYGASAIYISNHGGRQLDCAPGSIQVLPEIVDAVSGRAAVLMDGGIYRGTDVLKAIALGAQAVCIGRLQCWALAAGGEAGLVRMMEILEEEIIITMGLLGVTKLADLSRKHVVATDALDPPHIFNPFPVVKERLAALPPSGASKRD
jgi:isopentenyl diphosphate isomerase/L-lactate dehydrogenase-like FMN-dependent dehydrogenase